MTTTMEQSMRTMDDQIEEQILSARRVFISDAVDNESSEEVIRKLWYLDLVGPGQPIVLVINSPGGSVDCGFAIWDQIKMISSPVKTLVTGLAASMGSILSLVAGKGGRFATPYARFMVHQPALSGVYRGQATDLEIQAKEIIKTRETLIEIYAEATGKDNETIDQLIDRDAWMTAEEALQYGMLDSLVNSFDDLV